MRRRAITPWATVRLECLWAVCKAFTPQDRLRRCAAAQCQWKLRCLRRAYTGRTLARRHAAMRLSGDGFRRRGLVLPPVQMATPSRREARTRALVSLLSLLSLSQRPRSCLCPPLSATFTALTLARRLVASLRWVEACR